MYQMREAVLDFNAEDPLNVSNIYTKLLLS